MFNYYGDNVFKLGKAMDIEKRVSGYTTSCIDNTEVKFLSELCCDYSLAELIIFDRLKSNRIKQNKSITAREKHNKIEDRLTNSTIYRKHSHWHMHTKYSICLVL